MAKTNGDDKRKHLEIIQGVINRMSSNSFLFKGWSITIIAGISAFAAKDSNAALMIIPIVSSILFWGIDAYYLMLERAYRNLYKHVALKDSNDIDYSMAVSSDDKKFTRWLATLWRPVLWVFYCTVLIMLIILTLVLNNITLEVTINHGA